MSDDRILLAKEIATIDNMLKRKFEKMMTDLGLTGGVGRSLHYILIHDGDGEDVFQKDLEKEFSLKASSASDIIKKLEQKGYIIRVPVEHDARLKKIVPTDEIRAFQDKLITEMNNFEDSLSIGVSEEDKIKFHEICLILRNNLK